MGILIGLGGGGSTTSSADTIYDGGSAVTIFEIEQLLDGGNVN